MNHLQKFLIELGEGFAFMGRQYRIEVEGEDHFLDLLFYHVKLHCYIVVELKGQQTFMIAMNDPLDYVKAAAYAARQLGIEVLELVDPVGQDFCVDTTKARYLLGYRPQYDIFTLIDKAAAFRRSGEARRERSGFKG